MKFLETYWKVTAVILLCAFALQVLGEIFTYSETYDERGLINVGYRYLRDGEFNISINPPLTSVLNALPGLLYDAPSPTRWSSDPFKENFFNVLILSRLKTLIFGILLGIFILIFTKKLFGTRAGLLALFLFSFEPNIITHSSLATTDLLTAFFVFTSAYYFYKFIQQPELKTSIIAGIFLGFALISKFTAILLIPAYILIILLFLTTKNRRKYFTFFALTLFISVLIINSAYLFKGTFTTLGAQNVSSPLFKALPDFMPLFLPAKYIEGLGFIQRPHAGHATAYFHGRYSETGFWYYYLVAFAIKTPIPLMILFILGVIWLAKNGKRQLYFLMIPVFAFLIFFIFYTQKNIGLRYVLPIYPFLMVIGGTSIEFFQKRKALLFCLGAWYVLSAFMISPHNLAYFNEIVGGPSNGYKYLIDSNIDWGQGNNVLNTYLHSINTSVQDNIYSSYLNGINTTIKPNPGCEYTEGKIIIGVNVLYDLFVGNKKCHEWLRNLTPTRYIGYSIFVYDIPEKSNETT